jgi:hypothetical protein
MCDVSDDTDIAGLGGDLNPVTLLTIGDLKALLNSLERQIESREKVGARAWGEGRS